MCGAPGASSAPGNQPDPLDGLTPAADPLQARLHQIILYQKVSYANLYTSIMLYGFLEFLQLHEHLITSDRLSTAAI